MSEESPKSPSVRPKIRSNNNRKEPVQSESLENKKIAFIDHSGKKISIPLISKEFCPKLNCVHYYELSFNEFHGYNKMAINAWILNCKKFETFLSTIVHLPYFRFWSLVVHNKEVHEAIESYFNLAIRPYRIPPIFKNPEFRPILSNIHLMVFQFYIRILLNKENEKNYIEENYHSELLLKNNILDITKIIDLIQLYGFGPISDILKHLLKNFITKNYSHYNKDIQLVLQEIRQFFIHFKTNHSYDINNELVYIIANVNDVLFSLNKLVQFVPQIAFICQEMKLIESMIDFYIIYFPHIEQQTQLLFQNNTIVKNFYNYFKSQICLSKASALLFFHRMVHNFFIDQLVALQMDNHEILNILTNLFNYIASKKRFCQDYFSKFPFEEQYLTLKERYDNETGKNEILELYKNSLKPLIENYLANKDSSEPDSNVCDTTNYSSDYQHHQQRLPKSTINFEDYFKKDPEILSKESFILDMFPDLGDGFIYKCLEYYNFNTEQVLDSILECKLPPEIEQLDRKLTKSSLIQLMKLKEKEYQEKYLNDEKKYNSKIDTECQLTDIHIGKKDKISQVQKEKKDIINKTIELADKINEEEEEMREHVQTLIERGKLTLEELKTTEKFMGIIDIYNDEFDDTYGFENRFSVDNINETNENDDNNDEYSIDHDEQTNDLKTIETKQQPQHQSSAVSATGGKFRTNEKYENGAKYFRKQLYNKRNYSRQQQQQNRNNNNNGPNGQSKTSIVNQSNNNPLARNADLNEHRNSNKHANVSKDNTNNNNNNNNNNRKSGNNIIKNNNNSVKRNSNKYKR